MISLTLFHARVGDLVGCQVVLKNDFINLSYGFLAELVGPHIDAHDVLVALEGVFERGGVAFLYLVAAHVQRLDGLVRLEEFSERLAEHVAQLVRRQPDVFEPRVVVKQVYAQLAACLVVQAVQLEVEADQTFVYLECLRQITAAFVVDVVVPQIQMGQNGGLQHELRYFAGAGVTYFVVRKVNLADGLVEHEALDQNRN